MLLYKMDRVKRFGEMVGQIVRGHDGHFGQDLEDITTFLSDLKDEMPAQSESAGQSTNSQSAAQEGKADKEAAARTSAQAIWDSQAAKFEMIDWLLTVKDESRNAGSGHKLDNAEHAYLRWKEKRSLPWLLAALMLSDPGQARNHELTEAAAAVAPTSPGFETASWYLVDALMKKHKNAEAAKRLDLLLARKNLAPSAANMFVAQKAALATTFKQLITASVVRPAEVTDGLDMPNNWFGMQETNSFYPGTATFATETLLDINDNLPLSKWLEIAGYVELPAELHARVVRAAWMRAQILGQRAKADALEPQLKRAYPFLSKYLNAYDSARSSQEKNFALARLVLLTEGMSPYLESGIERHGLKLNEFDSYNDNYWMAVDPAKAYNFKPEQRDNSRSDSPASLSQYIRPVSQFLTAAERGAASQELKEIWQQSCPKFLGGPVLSWAESNGRDPRLPEALYRVVKLPRWSGRSPAGSKYSRAAYEVLHRNYPKNVWTNKAEFWY